MAHRIDTSTAQKDKFGVGKNGFTRGNPQTGVPATELDDDYFDMLQEEIVGIVEAAGDTLDKTKRNQLNAALDKLFQTKTGATSALGALVPAANRLPYFTGANGASLTDLTTVGRDILASATKAAVLEYLGLGDGYLPLTGGTLTGNDNVLSIKNAGANRANYIQGDSSAGVAEWLVGRLGNGSDVSLYSPIHQRSVVIKSDGVYSNNSKILTGVTSLLSATGYMKLGDSGLVLQWGVTPAAIGGESVDLSFPIAFPTACFAGVVSPTSSSNNTGYNSTYFHITSRTGFRITNDRSGTAAKLFAYWFAVGY